MLVNLSDIQKSQHEFRREREINIANMRKIISTWDKKGLQAYVYNKNKKYLSTDAGMAAILERFINTNEFQIGHMAEELKVGFDIVLSISRNNRISFATAELIYAFTKHFKEVITSYDRQSAQTYYHKLIQAYEQSVKMIEAKHRIEQEIRVKY